MISTIFGLWFLVDSIFRYQELGWIGAVSASGALCFLGGAVTAGAESLPETNLWPLQQNMLPSSRFVEHLLGKESSNLRGYGYVLSRHGWRL